MDVVDLTDGTHDDPLNVSRESNGADSARVDGSQLGLSQSRLGPKAAATVQTGAKRKLPDSFQQQSAKSKQSKTQAPAGRSNVRAAPPPAVRHPAVRITATPLAHNQAVACPAQNFSQAKSTLPASETATAPHSNSTEPLLPEHALPVLEQPASQASYAQRRVPESLAKVTNGSSTSSQTKAVGLRNMLATAADKAGPSEHDTKAALRAALEGLQMSGGQELNVPAGRMAIPLMRHQRLALAWMLHRERTAANPRGGILADDQGLGKTVSTIALIVTNQSGDDVADEGFEDLDSDEEDAEAGAAANAATPVNANQDARAVNAESSAACSTPQALSAPAISNGGSLTRDPQGSARMPDANACTDAPHTSAQAALAATDNPHQTTTSSSQHAADNFQPAAISVSRVPRNVVPNGTAKQAAADSHKHPELHSPPSQAQDTANTGLPEGGTLIVCPTAVLNQWARELEAKVAPPAGMTVYMYHGKGRGVKPQQLARYSCVLTTYTSMGMEAGPRSDAKHGINPGQPIELDEFGNDDDAAVTGSKGKKKLAGPLFQIHWWRVVLDESQAIKNAGTLVAHAAHCLQAGRRWCLSGTPIQNSVDDLYSCFRFLRYNPYCKKAAFKSMLKDPLQDNPAKGAQLLQVCLKALLLRRTKTSTIDGEPVVKLPPREQQLVCKAFSASEQRFYDQVQQESMQKLKALEEGGGGNSYVNMLWLLLRLRQACNHPWLVRGTAAQYGGAGACAPNGALGSPGGKVTTSQLSAAKKLAGQQCEQLLQTLQQEPSVCAQCGDISEEAVVSACCHVFCRQCITMQVGSLGGSKESESNFQCPTCSQPLSAAQVFTKPALKKARGQAEGTQEAGGKGQNGWHSSSKVEHLLELLRGMQHRGATGRAPVPGKPPGAAPNPLGGRSKSDMRLAAILGAPPRGSSPALTSSPTQEKVIVFSQWTSMLDLVEMALKKEKFVFRRLDGSMSMANRDQAIIDFQEKSGVNILIVSLKAAALGLNLVAANHVVLLDLWWNPTIEEQAIDRAHRIGQTRTVHVTRITIKGTVEERILALQESKRKIVSAAFGDDSGGFQQTSRLTKEDLHFLFTGQL
ncbi:hypothetical protein WJX77_004115 [Trebouxia sp. C0004]